MIASPSAGPRPFGAMPAMPKMAIPSTRRSAGTRSAAYVKYVANSAPATTKCAVARTASAGPTACIATNGGQRSAFNTPATISTRRRPTRSRTRPTSGRVATLDAIPRPSRPPIASSSPPSERTNSGNRRNIATLMPPVK